MKQELLKLQLKRASMFENIESLSSVSDSAYKDFGKVCADIMILKKKINREIKNIFQ
ncbi:hypothetical protein [uncultured Flavobacterium sp.]|uniref:hypothetical protein n=1 Tax=uncultured Flavobacterium sp. TaxID=165435 RepID=UPI0030EF7B67|tara:strand:+ start:768 stop:938 length:171 start_codon:yes stop_codon:yes gene_type:complete